jgi:XTP/dITP diphosphohydrolase
MHKIIFASRNKGKIREVKEILNGEYLEITSLIDLKDEEEIIEDGNTFNENARKKALHVFNKYRIPVIADDSGLIVEQLDGRPGVFSARYAGENATDLENNNKLIEELKDKPVPHHAGYYCQAVYYDGIKYVTAGGKLKGRIILSPQGDYGFGYDPLFIAENYDRTMAELDLNEKNKISHRGKAFNKLKSKLEGIL